MNPLLARLLCPVSIACAAFAASIGVFQTSAAAADDCLPDWIPTFGGQSQTPVTDGVVRTLVMFDDGAGPALYVGGDFTAAGGEPAGRIAKWDGQGWTTLGSGMNDRVNALAVFDDGSGSGPALYAGGSFTLAGGGSANRIAKWDGVSWSALGSGLNGEVHALTVFDEGSGSGPFLCVGGVFSSAGGLEADFLARWDGQSWSPLMSGNTGGIGAYALAVFDDGSGSGPQLYAGGSVSVPWFGVGKWEGHGQGWTTVMSERADDWLTNVRALTVFDDGSGAGPALCAGGKFIAYTAGFEEVMNNIAKWDGQSWSPLGSGMTGDFENGVLALTAFDDGSGGGPALYAAGDFNYADFKLVSRIAKWDGQGWNAVSGGMNAPVRALCAFDGGTGAGPALWAGGSFTIAGGESADFMAAWDGESWTQPGTALSGTVRALSAFDDGSGGGPALYAGGEFTSAGGQDANRIARWDGEGWSALGSGLNGSVRALSVFNDGSGAGSALYAGGEFTTAGGLGANRIARWDGQAWSALGSGMSGAVDALCVFDDGSGPALFAGGDFTTAGGATVGSIAKWDGQSWSALGTGMNSIVHALAVYDDGSGAGRALYAGGFFTSAGGQGANCIAKWDGQTWSALGSGMISLVETLAVFDDGSGAGPALFAGGNFLSAGGLSASCVARWDGQGWSGLGGGTNGWVRALAVFDGAGGPALHAGGYFTSAGGVSASRIARWDGQAWSALGNGMSSDVQALLSFDDGSGAAPALYAGGAFEVSPGEDSHLAKWGCPVLDTLPGCFDNPAALTSPSSAAAIGGTLELFLASSQLASGLGLLYLGADGTDDAGCGVLVPGLGELLLALALHPVPVASGSLAGGAVAFALPVPDDPHLVGQEFGIQGAVLGVFNPGVPLELSNGLRVTITQ